ncbi:hypothetical protein Y032_0163g3486 [Ancylostoma ceylanicum]|uniref:Uncharacterized protein n=1 Tax=Ancylostoma ceylanicum TaxID=53326 RepID=A0A016SXQ6_9BILA|nr:hypothetical protein Y032_0163g3486 [Ancylostoma ceylanicum]
MLICFLQVSYLGLINDRLFGLYQTTYMDSQGKRKMDESGRCAVYFLLFSSLFLGVDFFKQLERNSVYRWLCMRR